MIGSSVIGFITFPLHEVVKAFKAPQDFSSIITYLPLEIFCIYTHTSIKTELCFMSQLLFQPHNKNRKETCAFETGEGD